MPNFNKVMLMGHITRDLEVWQAGSVPALNFGIAVNRKWKGSDGEAKEEVSFIDLSAFGKTAELISQYFVKGQAIFVEGRLKQDSWEKDGEKKTRLKVVVETFQFVGSKKSGDDAEKNYTAPKKKAMSKTDVPDEDIPF